MPLVLSVDSLRIVGACAVSTASEPTPSPESVKIGVVEVIAFQSIVYPLGAASARSRNVRPLSVLTSTPAPLDGFVIETVGPTAS